MAFGRFEPSAKNPAGVDQRVEAVNFVQGNDFEVDSQIARLGMLDLELVEALGRRGQIDATDRMNAAGLAGLGFDLGELGNGVVMDLRHGGQSVQHMIAGGGVPGRAGGQFRAFQQHDIGPAELGQVVENTATGNAAADDDCLRVGFHDAGPAGKNLSIHSPIQRRRQTPFVPISRYFRQGGLAPFTVSMTGSAMPIVIPPGAHHE